MTQPLKRQQVIGIFGEERGTKLLNWLDPCCDSFCLSLLSCLGISDKGDPTLVLNQQGDWITNGVGKYIAVALNCFIAPSGTNFVPNLAISANSSVPENFSAATSIRARATSTLGNLNAATQGSVDFYLLVSTLP